MERLEFEIIKEIKDNNLSKVQNLIALYEEQFMPLNYKKILAQADIDNHVSKILSTNFTVKNNIRYDSGNFRLNCENFIIDGKKIEIKNAEIKDIISRLKPGSILMSLIWSRPRQAYYVEYFCLNE